jgi:hypothetical protein
MDMTKMTRQEIEPLLRLLAAREWEEVELLMLERRDDGREEWPH